MKHASASKDWIIGSTAWSQPKRRKAEMVFAVSSASGRQFDAGHRQLSVSISAVCRIPHPTIPWPCLVLVSSRAIKLRTSARRKSSLIKPDWRRVSRTCEVSIHG